MTYNIRGEGLHCQPRGYFVEFKNLKKILY